MKTIKKFVVADILYCVSEYKARKCDPMRRRRNVIPRAFTSTAVRRGTLQLHGRVCSRYGKGGLCFACGRRRGGVYCVNTVLLNDPKMYTYYGGLRIITMRMNNNTSASRQ